MDKVKFIVLHRRVDNGVVLIPDDNIAAISESRDSDKGDKVIGSSVYLVQEFFNAIEVNEKPMKIYEQLSAVE